jgi:hypothetical protein
MYVDRRSVYEEDRVEIEERLMELEADVENIHKGNFVQGSIFKNHGMSSALTRDDYEDDSDQEMTFISPSKPIVTDKCTKCEEWSSYHGQSTLNYMDLIGRNEPRGWKEQ